VVPEGQAQSLFTQTRLLAQTWAQKPQLFLSLVRLTQVRLHMARPAAQVVAHAPLLHTWPIMQRLPQAPQLPRSDCKFAQSMPQLVSPALQVQTLDTHVAPAGQRLPQLPQLRSSVCVSTQAPAMPHEVSPVGHPPVHVPPTHWLPGPQRVPQPPQSFGSVLVSTQAVPHIVVPVPHVHMLETQLAPFGHAVPQPPQFCGSLVSLTQALLQSVSPVPHEVVQTPAEHTWFAPHLLPQEPQLSGSLWVAVPHEPQLALSVCSFTQAPPHWVSPAVQLSVHLPFAQTCPGPHWLLHAPQSSMSVCSLTHAPLQAVSPVGQLQLPPWHVAPVAQTVPHEPQLALSVCSFTQALPHWVRPVPHVDMHAPFEQTLPVPQA
jgi:hypothetical protein